MLRASRHFFSCWGAQTGVVETLLYNCVTWRASCRDPTGNCAKLTICCSSAASAGTGVLSHRTCSTVPRCPRPHQVQTHWVDGEETEDLVRCGFVARMEPGQLMKQVMLGKITEMESRAVGRDMRFGAFGKFWRRLA